MYLRTDGSFARGVSSVVACAVFGSVLLPGFVAFADDTPPPSDPTPAPSSESTAPPANDPGAPGQGGAGETAPSGPDTQPTSGDNGQNGQNAASTTPTNDGQPSSAPAQVDTGNATASTTASNDTNSNTITTDTSGTTTIDASSTAAVDNGATTTAATGANAANGGGGGNAAITTGDALAASNVINVVNTNIIDSTGLLLFLNLIMGGTFDLRLFDLSYFFGGGASSASGCTLFSCNDASLNVNANNDATVTNDVVVRADSGGNTATSTGSGYASIDTGNAYAAANVLNLINSNFINSNYLLVSLNSFGDLNQDIVLPNAEFFQQLLSHNSSLGSSLAVNATNTADVSNGTNVGATTGDNTASTTGNGAGSITSGNAYAGATTVNQVNTNEIGGAHIFLLFRVWGNWTGAVQGLPSGISWAQTPYGIQLMNTGGTSSPESALFGGGGGCCGSGGTTVNATNNASIKNNVNVWALTGNNQTNTADGSGTIHTGNAYASANTINFVNTNVIGRNWIFAIFNIFGNWSGNISFGRPDLWIGGTAQASSNPIYTDNGGSVTYHFTVSNRGDLDATNVRLDTSFAKNLLTFSDGTGTARGEQWNLGTVRRGETRDVSFTATVHDAPQEGASSLPLTATVTSTESDNNPLDNTEQINVMVARHPVAVTGIGGVGVYTNDPHITMTKTTSAVSTSTPASVDYKVEIRNDGGPAYKTVLTDSMNQPNGTEVYSRSWNLDTIRSGEEITLTYTVQYTGDLPPGLYTNVATLTGRRNNPDDRYAVDMLPVQASASVQVLGPRPEVLGASTEAPMCKPLLLTYLKIDQPNNPTDVTNLQTFFNTHEGEHLDVNGVYDSETVAAVKHFQDKYKDDVLTPWGITRPTGYVYYTTQREVNALACNGSGEFTLQPQQVVEISKFRAGVRSSGHEPENPDVGSVKPVKGSRPTVIVPSLPKPQMSQMPKLPPAAENVLHGKKVGNGLLDGVSALMNGFLSPFVDASES